MRHNMKTYLWIVLLLPLFLTSCINPLSKIIDAINSDSKAGSLSIYAINVGQGDATLVIGPNGRAALIDAGPPGAGLSRVLPELEDLGVATLSWILISHYDADHLGGLLELLRGKDKQWDTEDDVLVTDWVWDRGGQLFDETLWFDEYESELESRNFRRTVQVGQDLDLGDGVQVTVVLSDGKYDDGSVHPLNPDEENESSIALLIEYDKFRYLTAGDLTGGGFSGTVDTKDLETHLAEIVGPISVLHLNHHGSETSNNANYLDDLAPDAAIVSAGKNNDFDHPDEATLLRLEERGIPLHRTEDGTIQIVTDGESYDISQ